jgi:hypothetical protein
VRRAPLILAFAAATTACKDPPPAAKRVRNEAQIEAERAAEAEGNRPPPEPEPLRTEDGARVELGGMAGLECARTLCIAGPDKDARHANRDLAELCRRAPGVVRRCEDKRCASVWTLEQWSAGLAAVVASLDENGDGKVDGKDPACPIFAAGWSTGGVAAAEDLPKQLAADARLAKDRAVVDRLVLIAPWAPEHEQISVAENVRKAWIYRHTKTPKDDCSKAFEGGPWLSPPPVCGPETQCIDYDYSYEPELAYLSRRGSRAGPEIGHCLITAVVAKVGLANLVEGEETWAELCPPKSNGEPGGRTHPIPEPPKPGELEDEAADAKG